METAAATPKPRRSPSTKRPDKSPEYLLTRDEAKELLGEYAFSLIDEAKTDDELENVLDKLDAEGVDTETYEDAVFVRMMEESRNSGFVSREQVMKSLNRL